MGVGEPCNHYFSNFITYQPIECVHDGHVGGPKQNNDFPLGNIFYFYANVSSIVLVFQHGRRAHTILIILLILCQD